LPVLESLETAAWIRALIAEYLNNLPASRRQ